jgi:hypothetical protein
MKINEIISKRRKSLGLTQKHYNVTVEMIEQGEDTGYIFLIAGCYNQQKPKSTEHEAYLSAIEYIIKKK